MMIIITTIMKMTPLTVFPSFSALLDVDDDESLAI